MPKLGVNVDHIATLRQARRGFFPDPVYAARVCEKAGCHSIVAHLREDRRHINDDDVKRLKKSVRSRFNLEMSIAPGIVDVACRIRPHQATLVPEKRKELTTEGGLDVIAYKGKIKRVVARLDSNGIEASIFIDPDGTQILSVPPTGAKIIELHTGSYAQARTKTQKAKELDKIVKACCLARDLGLRVNAGHGLDYGNAGAVAEVEGIEELNIGYSIICNSVFWGLESAVRKMLGLIR